MNDLPSNDDLESYLYAEIFRHQSQVEFCRVITSLLDGEHQEYFVKRSVVILLEEWPANGRWWESDFVEGMVRLLSHLQSLISTSPASVFYAKDQTKLMTCRESIVLLRGNQEIRSHAKLLLPLFDLQSKAELIEYENSIQMRHELQVHKFKVYIVFFIIVGRLL